VCHFRLKQITIHEVAADVLSENQRAMTADEIYEVIIERGLYEFKAKSPKSVLRSQLRKHCKSNTGGNTTSNPLFSMTSDGAFNVFGG
jgi:hypothetical protein